MKRVHGHYSSAHFCACSLKAEGVSRRLELICACSSGLTALLFLSEVLFLPGCTGGVTAAKRPAESHNPGGNGRSADDCALVCLCAFLTQTGAMRTTLRRALFSIQLYGGERNGYFTPPPQTASLIAASPPVCAELIFRQLTEGQTLQLSCSLPEQQGGPTGLHLYHCSGQTQTTLLSMVEGAEPKVNPEHRGRLQLQGGLRCPQVNVSVSHLQRSDTGLYVWELSSRVVNASEQVSVSAAKVLLLVEGLWFSRQNFHFSSSCCASDVNWCLCLCVCVVQGSRASVLPVTLRCC